MKKEKYLLTENISNGLITAISKGSTDVVVSREGANNAIFTISKNS